MRRVSSSRIFTNHGADAHAKKFSDPARFAKKAGPAKNRLFQFPRCRRGSATVALAGLRSFAGFRSADLSAVGTFAGFSFDAAIFVRIPDTAGAAMCKDLTGCDEGRRQHGDDDFHDDRTIPQMPAASRFAGLGISAAGL